MDNFICLGCGHTFMEPHYKMSFPKRVMLFRDKNDNQLKCPKCSSINLEEIEKDGFGVPAFGKFSSSSEDNKKRILRKRAKEHITKTDRERKEHLDRNFAGKLKHGDY